MPKVIHFYVDDSGTRHPDHRQRELRKWDWFALGGVLIAEEDEDRAREALTQFRRRWPKLKDFPLHSYDIRNRTRDFLWLTDLSEHDHGLFMGDLGGVMCSLPTVGLACVIDRPG